MKLFLVRALAGAILSGALVACDGDSPTAPQSAALTTLRSVDPEPSVDPGPFTRALGGIAELSGRCPAVSFVIGSFHVWTNGTTLFQRFECRELTNGTHVDATGAIQADRTLFAREVELIDETSRSRGRQRDGKPRALNEAVAHQ